ncbi:MAG: branched-chain amino acid ABC transporter permease [Lachnospiraceae bacterium]|nr:branched-chain amino acid ABC transporter permease [Lachnospiraceae bacterium]
MSTFLQYVFTGISVGGCYALIAIGYTLVYGILRLINFAHGDIFMMAGYFMIFSFAVFPFPVAIIITLVATTALGILIEKFAYSPLRQAPRMSVMISAIGVSYLLQNLSTYLFSGLPQPYPAIPGLKQRVMLGDASVSLVTFITPIVTIIIVLLLLRLVNKTKIGMAMRAVSKDYEAASLMGIKLNTTISFTFAVGSLLAAVGSILYFTDRSSVYPFSGALPGLKCFVAAVFGGIGSIPGALLGGFFIGISETIIKAVGLSTFSDAFTFIILIIMLIVKPTGLFGEKSVDKV